MRRFGFLLTYILIVGMFSSMFFACDTMAPTQEVAPIETVYVEDTSQYIFNYVIDSTVPLIKNELKREYVETICYSVYYQFDWDSPNTTSDWYRRAYRDGGDIALQTWGSTFVRFNMSNACFYRDTTRYLGQPYVGSTIQVHLIRPR